ncbi:aminopeptidase P family protein [Mariniplasma anaerobium]|uniref:Xaa-Pro aminopeptidase n=1 Tax=Mariniplasma anaerobium TaxID=2735436 RepID=A0A7U9TIX0_9MOLU|nr:aminopeptidase P family protein [Mariniplasma anaerobium]BCR36036.1 Xaa-Pro aminopeptidase [Mariniplasma anaerobium]
MYKKRRDAYLNNINDQSISLFFSGVSPQKSNDQHYHFSVNRNFYYLTGINQQNVVLMTLKGNNEAHSYLFIETIDPVKALWDGAGLSFEEASKVSGIDLTHVKDILTLKSFLNGLVSTNRRAAYGFIESLYLDLERQSENSAATQAGQFSSYVQTTYPYLNIKTNQLVLAELRTVKDEQEIELVNKAVDITYKGLNRIMDTLKPGVYEYEIQAEYNYVLNKHRTDTSFDTIAASGQNATVLHYVENDSKILDNTLVLFDLGVDYEFYCSDVTRTFPANGKFTKRQKEVYEVVLEANKKTIEWLKPGITMKEFNDYGKNILIQGAKRIGLIKEDAEISKYYYHSLGHYLGLDVHDVGNYSKEIPVGALITVEPGLYIAEEGIGIRIEDDIYVTKDGSINLTKKIIKEVKDIETYMNKN